jgi:D-3-phosphoglycerate dehydrogenase
MTTDKHGFNRVLVSTSSFGSFNDRPIRMLEDTCGDIRFNPHGRTLRPEETVGLLQDVDGLIAGTERLDAGILARASSLRVISRCGTGLDNVDLEAAARMGINVYGTTTAHVDGVAELCLAGILDVLRGVSLADRGIRAGQWLRPRGRLLAGKTVGIVGLGRVGKRLVELLGPFRVQLLACDPCPDAAFAEQHGVQYCQLEELLPQADIVSLNLPFTRESYHMIDSRHLALMKPDAILVNCARGGVVDERALVACLQNGRLGGAFLDTFQEEPYAGALTEQPNVLLTSHIGSYAAESRVAMELEAVENLLGFLREGNGR